MALPPIEAQNSGELRTYLDGITHSWLKTVTILGMVLVPVFFLLDCVMIPDAARHLLPRFFLYRATATILTALQFLWIRRTAPSRYSFIHGYIFTAVTTFAIVLMTQHLGGFSSKYYAGLNLVIIAVDMLLPWAAIHSIVNGLVPITMYVVVNAFWGGAFEWGDVINNLYFMLSTVVIATSITYLKYELVKKEFLGRQELSVARDALWGEMEIAKRIQTALLPIDTEVGGFVVAATMLPADEVGGDYYDVIDTGARKWFMVGDVSGHGVESGLIMMMTQTSVRSTLVNNPQAGPSQVLSQVNVVIKDNIARLKAERYMTITALCIEGETLSYAGKHQDIFIFREATKQVEVVETDGTWLGIVDNLGDYLVDHHVPLKANDIVLLFTDGVTEAEDCQGILFGEDRLSASLKKHAHLQVKEILSNILRDVTVFGETLADDVTLLLIKKL